MNPQNEKAKTQAPSLKATISSRTSQSKNQAGSPIAGMGLVKEEKAASSSARNETRSSGMAGRSASQRVAMQQAPLICGISPPRK